MIKATKPKTLKTFECWIDWGDGERHPSTFAALSASKARYQFHLGLDFGQSYKETQKFIKVKSLGPFNIKHIYGEVQQFERVCKSRQIEFAHLGMIINVCGKPGWIVGGNSSNNLEVLFEGQTSPSNCHPYYETTYYDSKLNVVKDFKKQPQ